MCMENPLATVTQVTSKPKRKWRPFPLNTVELQKLASKKCRIGAEATMNIAEKLYQEGFISYPRTETDSFAEGTDLHSLIRLQTDDPAWGQYAISLLEGKFVFPKVGRSNDNAHPPIYPTKHATGLQGDRKQIYDLVTRHFLACCSEDGIGHETVVDIDIAGEKFTAKGLMILEYNYLEVYVYDKWSDKNIPVFEQGEQIMPSKLFMHEGTTSPPSLISEPELIQIMDQTGIGTDATIAQHIEKIQTRKYVTKQNNFFAPTTLGAALVAGYLAMGLTLSKPELRAAMEADMKLISRGTKNREQVVQHHLAQTRDIFQQLVANVKRMDDAMGQYFEPLANAVLNADAVVVQEFTGCGKCGGMMALAETEAAQGVERTVLCRACNLNLHLPRMGRLAPHENRCNVCKFQIVAVTTEKGDVWQYCPWCKNNPSIVRPCPTCGKDMLLKSRNDQSGYFLSCKGYQECNTALSLPRCFEGITVTDQKCPKCTHVSINLLDMKINRRAAPPGFPPEMVSCVGGCDNRITEVLLECNRRNISAFFEPARARPNNTVNANGSRTQFTSSNSNFSTNNNTSSNQNTYNNNNNNQNNYQNNNNQNYNQNNNQNKNNNQNSNNDDPNGIVKYCPQHSDAILLFRRKKSDGAGFYICSSRETTDCRYYQPADDNNNNNTNYSNNNNNSNNNSNNFSTYNNNNSNSSNTNATCFHCHEPGHFASQCPVKASGGGGGGSGGTCYTCGEPGHFSGSCPNKGANKGGGNYSNNNNNFGGGGGGNGGNGGSGGGRTCFKCGEAGHFANVCPNKGSSNSGGGSSYGGGATGSCFKCGNTGHYANSCPNKGGSGGGNNSYNKGGNTGGDKGATKGRKRKEAPSTTDESPAKSGTRKCSVCKQPGHTKNKCPNL